MFCIKLVRDQPRSESKGLRWEENVLKARDVAFCLSETASRMSVSKPIFYTMLQWSQRRGTTDKRHSQSAGSRGICLNEQTSVTSGRCLYTGEKEEIRGKREDTLCLKIGEKLFWKRSSWGFCRIEDTIIGDSQRRLSELKVLLKEGEKRRSQKSGIYFQCYF